MSAGNSSGIVEAIRIDLKRLHETWMEFVYPRQVDADDTVLGKWTPDSQGGWVAYRAWGALGALTIGILYPIVVLGYVLRAQAERLDWVAAYVGAIGIFLGLTVLWGALTVVAWLQFTRPGFIAVLAASVVAVVSGLLAYLFSRIGGRGTTVLLAYPFAITALLLPPVVAALFSETLAQEVFSRSNDLAAWFRSHVLAGTDLNEYLKEKYDLEGLAYPALWLGISFPVGWVLGVVVTLANYVRPSGSE